MGVSPLIGGYFNPSRISRRVETAFEGMPGWKLLWSFMGLSSVDRLAYVIARDNAVSGVGGVS